MATSRMLLLLMLSSLPGLLLLWLLLNSHSSRPER